MSKPRVVEDLEGIGPATAKKLKTVGFTTIEHLATATERELMQKGIGEETAKKVIKAARKTIIESDFITAEDYHKTRSTITLMSTGCKSVDSLLRGGLRTQSITEFYGEFGSGKSQICQQLCVMVQLPEEEGGLGGSALYIDTENIFDPPRLVEIAKRFPSIDDPLKNIIIAEAYTSEHQIILLENSDSVIKDNNVRLIIIDSLLAHFRSEYVGREFLAPRQQTLNKHLHKLKRLAMAFNAVAVVTNQVLEDPTPFGGYAPKPVGGHVLGHAAATRIFIRKAKPLPNRIFKIVASPFLPDGEIPAQINENGVVHVGYGEEAVPN